MTEESAPQPSEEEILEQLKKLKIEDVLLQTVVTLVNLTGRKLAVEDEKDLEQGRKGIEAARALLPLLPEEGAQPVKDAIAQLQMVYVRETKGAVEPEGVAVPKESAEPEGPAQPPPRPKPDIWTPPGT